MRLREQNERKKPLIIPVNFYSTRL